MQRSVRLALLVFVVLLAVPVASIRAATRMPIGFYDDGSFRFSADREANLAAAAATGASVIQTTANWATIAPTRPADASSGDDPAYQLSDLDQLVREASRYGIRVLIDINGTPKWANGNQTPNHMPTHLSDLTTFARMIASRYNGETAGQGSVNLFAVWNEPNLQQFLTPQYVGKKIVSPANYAKLYKAAYAGIIAGNPRAQVAIGVTSAQGRDKPSAGASQTVSPGTFALLLSQQKGLKFTAWAHHPYPTSPSAAPLEKVRYPNVTLSQLPTFEANLAKYFHRAVPVWITEYGHETKPAVPNGVTYAQQAAYAKQALTIVRNDPNVQMFIWFTFRDSTGNPWRSGLEQPSGAPKPAYAAFGALARVIDGSTVSDKAGKAAPAVKVYVPLLSFYDPPGTEVGVTFQVLDGTKLVAKGYPQVALAADQSLTFSPGFTPVKGQTYTIKATAMDINGNSATRTVVVHAT